MIRKTIFWLHLGSGVLLGIVVAIMSFTGVILTYEHQMLDWSDRHYRLAPAPGESRRDPETLIQAARSSGLSPRELVYAADSTKPVIASEGRRGKSIYVNQYTGEVLGEPSPHMRGFVRAVTGWHRWFNATGESRDTARLVTGVSNLAFLFLILTGMYLWLPRVFRWPLFRARLRFQGSYRNAKLRDFHWHHIFGIWSAIPLAVVVATAVVFSFTWANDLVFRMAGGDQSPGDRASSGSRSASVEDKTSAETPSLDQLLTHAMQYDEEWRTVTLKIPDTGAQGVTFVVDKGSGRQPQLRTDVVIDVTTSEVTRTQSFADMPAGRQARFFIRFLHTGEVYGFIGQTIAGLVSLASLLMVWTGLALSWRRLISPLFARRDI